MRKTAYCSPFAWLRQRGIVQMLLAMKLTVLLLTAALLNVSANGLAQKITYSASGTSLEKVFTEIEKQTGFVFLYKEGLLTNTKPVSIKAKDLPLEDFLEKLLRGQPLVYRIADRTVFITRQTMPGGNNNTGGLLPAPGSNPSLLIPPIQIRIKVVGADGSPLTGATVTNKNSGVSKVTGPAGELSLQVNPGDVLEVSFVGFEKATHKVAANATSVLIKLEMAEKILDEVVTGYSRMKKESFTGNSIQVTQKDILKVSNRNLVDVLQVFDPSFRIEVNNVMGSDPNTLPEFYIRGRSGIGVKTLDQVDVSQAALTNNPNLPIFIMDGYEVSAERVYDFDINRIKNITILKDAAATAVYGSRSANGVVVIETIAPVPGKLRLDYTMVGSLTLPDLSDYNLMNAEEKLQAEILAGYYNVPPGMTPVNKGALLKELLMKQNQIARGVNTDWIAQPVENVFNHKHTLNIDGGSDNLRFNFLVKYDKQKGVMKSSFRERKGGGLGIDYRQKKFQVRNDITYDVVDAVASPYGDFSTYATKAPYDEIYGPDGRPVKNTMLWHVGDGLISNRFNPMYEPYNTNSFDKNGYYSLVNNTAIIWNFLPKFQLRADLALTRQDSWTDVFIDPASSKYNLLTSTDLSNIGELTRTKTVNKGYNTNLFLRYENRFAGHSFNFSGGMNARETNVTMSAEYYTGFPSGSQNSPNFANKIVRKPAYSDNHTRLFGSFVTMNYAFQDIYLLDVSGRLDGSSEFGSDNRFAPFWSVGTGINFHKYKWVKDLGIFNRLRLTGTTGELGKTNFPPYAAKGLFAYQDKWYATGNGAFLMGMESPALTWEKTTTYDLILDFGIFKDLLSVNIDLYNKITNNLVNDVDLPLSSGYTSYKDNIGKVRNKGFEVFVRANIIREKDFQFSVYGNFASNKNELLELSNSLKKYNDLVNTQYDGYTGTAPSSPHYLEKFSTPYTKYVEGGSLTSIFGMRSMGINPMNGKEVYVRPDGTITYDWLASDQTIIGDYSPKGQGSFGFNIGYKAFSLFASFLYQYGAQEYNKTLVTKVENVDIYNKNGDKRILLQRWVKPGDITPLKDIASRSFTTRPSSRFIQDNNFVRFNSLSIAYDLVSKKLLNYGISRMKVQLSSNNLATWSTILQERGTSYPFARNYDLTVKIVL